MPKGPKAEKRPPDVNARAVIDGHNVRVNGVVAVASLRERQAHKPA
jgi:hypothetical protein